MEAPGTAAVDSDQSERLGEVLNDLEIAVTEALDALEELPWPDSEVESVGSVFDGLRNLRPMIAEARSMVAQERQS
jgi:hypothetical protein